MEMEWTRGITIGHGSSATVYLATSRRSSSDVSAVKSAEISSLSKSEQLQREQRILCSLSSHPHIVSYKGCNITKENNKLLFNLFMEYMPFGNLSQATLRHGGGRLEEPAVAHYARQIVMGLEYLHANGVVHCDIKGSNILVSQDGVVKIGDFGCAKRVSVNENDLTAAAAVAIGGTPMFMAPEVARGEEQGYPCDVWALGCTVVEMATGFAPWPNVEDPVSVLYRVAYSGESPEIPCFLSEQAKDFLGKCFRRDPKERWSCSQLLKHPFLAEFDSNNNNNAKGLLNNNNSSSSPTSILEQGFWNFVVEEESESESECFLFDNLGIENSPAGRIKRLALWSGDPNWTWGDENWITTRGNDAGAASSSTSDWYDLDELERSDVSGRISGYNICEDYDCNRDVSVVVNSLNFERGIAFAQMLLPSTLDFL